MKHKDATVIVLPQLMQVSQYEDWKEKFEVFVKSEDTRMWRCIMDGYIPPTHEVDGRIKMTNV
ncbi:hypothetical protein Hanom_Chr11g00997701 [Helianthus anomalus]